MEPGDVFVCAVGADEQGERLVRCARRLARVAGLRPLFVHVIEPAAQDPLDVWEARSMLRHAGASAREMRVESGETAPALARVARQEGAVLIVVASRGFGPLKAALLGSVSHALMTDAPVPVMILPPEVEPWFNTDRVLCGVDPDREEGAVVEASVQLARALNRGLVVAHVVENGAAGVERDGESVVRVAQRGAVDALECLADDVGADITVVGWPGLEHVTDVLDAPVAVGLTKGSRRAVVIVPGGSPSAGPSA